VLLALSDIAYTARPYSFGLHRYLIKTSDYYYYYYYYTCKD